MLNGGEEEIINQLKRCIAPFDDNKVVKTSQKKKTFNILLLFPYEGRLFFFLKTDTQAAFRGSCLE